MHQKLEEILTRTRADLAERKERIPLDVLKKSIPDHDARPFATALEHPKGALAVIAEVKFASPSAGVLGSADELIERVRAYESAGADAISLVTEKHFFHGDPAFISRVKEAVSLPVLQKDFIVEPYQLYEAKGAGADAILLIARIVPDATLAELVREAKSIGLAPVVEIHDAADIEKAVATGAIIAVNARDLDTFTVDVAKACDVIAALPDSCLALGFSGVAGKSEAEAYRKAGADGILVGTALMQSDDIGAFLKTLV